MKETITSPEANLEAYQARLDRLILEESPAVFANYSRAHARCIIKTFLSGAKEHVDILAGDFGNDFYRQESVKSAITQAVKNGARIRVVSLGTSAGSKSQVKDLAESIRDECQTAESKGQFLYKFAKVREGSRVKHYMIVDGKRYRLEDYHDEGSNQVHAEVCCNGPEKAAFLTRTFDSVWDRLSEPA